MTPIDLAAVGEHGVGDDAHEPDVAAAVDEPDAAAREERAEPARGGGVLGRTAGRRAAEDAQAHGATVHDRVGSVE